MESARPPHGNAIPHKRLLKISNGMCAEVKNRCSQRGISLTRGKDFNKMLRVACSTGGNHRNRNRRGDSRGKFTIKAQPGAVAVHGCEKYFASATLFRFTCPL